MREYIYVLFLLTSLISYGYAAGGQQEEKDPNDPKYQNMAEEVVRFHLNVTKQDTKKVTVSKVTTQVVAGLLTRIQFRVFLVNGKSAMCNSEIWDQPWKDLRVVTYKCDSLFSNKRLSSRVNSRPAVTRDPKNPKYQKLANVALDSFFETPGSKLFNKKDIKSVSVTSVKVKIGSQITNTLVVDVTTLNNGQFECEGVVLESPWKTVDTIEVTNMNCDISKRDATKGLLMGQSGKNQQIGGQVSQNPKDSKYKRLAEASFKRYLQSHTSVTISVKKLTVDKVTTQVVAGTMIRIDFHVDPTKGATVPCISEIWEKVDGKLNFKVMCQLNDVKAGGQKEQDPEDPQYKQLAEESFQKYRDTHIGPLFVVKEIKVTRVTTQVVAGVATNLDFNVITDSSYRYHCHSEVLEQPWRKIKDITVICEPLKKLSAFANSPKVNDNVDERLGGQTNEDPKDPKYKKLADESFKRYLQSHTSVKISVKKITVDKVTTQEVAGIMIRIDFHVDHTKGPTIPCKSEIWEKVDDTLDFNVICHLNDKKFGGQNEQDPKDPKYKQLAEESFHKYRNTHIGPLFVVKEIKVTRVTTQVVAGVATKLDFNVITDSSYRYHCHSEVLEQPWRKIKDITVICEPLKKLSAFANSPKVNDSVDERLGGQTNEDPKDPKYKKLADESFKRYLQSHTSVKISVKKLTVDKVTTQVVAGTMIRIDFHVDPTKGATVPCISEIWEKVDGKLNFKVMCQLNDVKAGGQKEQDPEDPQYKQLAEESFQKYRDTHIGPLFVVKEIKVTRVTTQVVAGVATNLDFNVITDSSYRYHCHSEVLEQPWRKIKDITVICEPLKKLSAFANSPKVNDNVDERLGGQTNEDPKDPKYKKLADESFKRYLQSHTSVKISVKKLTVDKVTTQEVAGTMIRIDFHVDHTKGPTIPCKSEIWEKVDDTLDFNVMCHLNDKKLGGQDDQDPEDPKYKQLAEESFQKYRNTHIGPLFVVKEIKVTRVTTQVVTGVVTKLDFNVYTDSSYRYHCHSEVLEQPWRQIKDITVICDPQNKLSAFANSPKVNDDVDDLLVGGETNQDPKNPKYYKFAEESFEKYRRDHIGLLFTVKELKVIKVTTQVVTGIITRLDFKAIPTKGKVLQCHSEILDQPWLQNKDIKVNCFSPSKLTLSKSASRLKVTGDFNVIDEAITDYFENFDTKRWTVENSEIKSFNKIRTRYGKEDISYYKVDVFASNRHGDYCYYNCSVVFARNKRNEEILIGVNCNKDTSLTGRTDWMDPSNKKYLTLADRAIKQYVRTTKNRVGLRGKYDVVVTFAASSLAAGTWNAINFVIRPLKVNVHGLKCYTKVWEDLKGKSTITEVNCEYNT